MARRVAESAAALVALRNVMQRVQQACDHAHRPASQVRVVAVSKTKPVSMIQEVYDGGHRHFGENYVQEFLEKAPQLPADIQWHFVGHLQSNKAKVLVSGVPNLYMVEGVDSLKVANHLDRAVSGVGRQPLRVLVQVNTSGEECGSQTLTLSSSFRTYKISQSIDNFIRGSGTHVFVTLAADLKIIWGFFVI
jgi:pyridoxal phosphate enzyme (YggS family)